MRDHLILSHRYGFLITLSVLFGLGYLAYIIYWLRTRKARRLKSWILRIHKTLIDSKPKTDIITLYWFGKELERIRKDVEDDYYHGRLNEVPMVRL
jgi:hypothetical protein